MMSWLFDSYKVRIFYVRSHVLELCWCWYVDVVLKYRKLIENTIVNKHIRNILKPRSNKISAASTTAMSCIIASSGERRRDAITAPPGPEAESNHTKINIVGSDNECNKTLLEQNSTQQPAI